MSGPSMPIPFWYSKPVEKQLRAVIEFRGQLAPQIIPKQTDNDPGVADGAGGVTISANSRRLRPYCCIESNGRVTKHDNAAGTVEVLRRQRSDG